MILHGWQPHCHLCVSRLCRATVNDVIMACTAGAVRQLLLARKDKLMQRTSPRVTALMMIGQATLNVNRVARNTAASNSSSSSAADNGGTITPTDTAPAVATAADNISSNPAAGEGVDARSNSVVSIYLPLCLKDCAPAERLTATRKMLRNLLHSGEAQMSVWLNSKLNR